MARLPLLLLPLPLLLAACAANGASPTKTDVTGSGDRARWEAAEKLKNSGDLMGAAQIFGELARNNPDSVDAEMELAWIDRKLGKGADAVKIMKDARARQPNNDTVSAQLGFALIDAGHPDEAVKLFEGLIHKDPSNITAYSGKGIAFDKAGNHLAAQDIYQQALKIAPGTLSVENNLAMSLILNNQLDQAITLLTTLSRQYPDNKTVRHNLALAYGLKGDDATATELNLKDLTPEQAKENVKFYQYYSHLREKFTTSNASKMQIGFSETPEEDKKIVPYPAVADNNTAKAPAEHHNKEAPVAASEPAFPANTNSKAISQITKEAAPAKNVQAETATAKATPAPAKAATQEQPVAKASIPATGKAKVAQDAAAKTLPPAKTEKAEQPLAKEITPPAEKEKPAAKAVATESSPVKTDKEQQAKVVRKAPVPEDDDMDDADDSDMEAEETTPAQAAAYAPASGGSPTNSSIKTVLGAGTILQTSPGATVAPDYPSQHRH